MKLMAFATLLTLAGASPFQTAAQPPKDGAHVTVEGCLQQAVRNGSLGGSVVGTSASPNTAPVEANLQTPVDAYLLTEAAVVPDPSAGRDITSFGLSGKEAELAQHRGARVRVVGTVMPPATSGRGTGGAATAAGTRRVAVESFTVMADRCEGRK